MSNTPRTDVLLVVHDFDPKPDTIINHARQLERELNWANDRIKRLEEAGDRMAATHLEKPSYESALYDVCAWDKAKEAKP